mgnify:CR=1 FL=1
MPPEAITALIALLKEIKDWEIENYLQTHQFALPLEFRQKTQEFLELANVWWWESNRSIPINIFLKTDWDPFKPYLRTFANKDLEILHGPVCSLSEMARKKSKRKSITLVRRLD